MKKSLLIAACIGASISLQAQDETVNGNLDITGNLGIGIANPTEKLQVNTGLGDFKTYLYGAETTVQTTGGWARGLRIRNETKNQNVVFGAHSGDAYIATGFDAIGNPTGHTQKRLVIKSNGKIGIGIDNPTTQLEIMSSEAKFITLKRDGVAKKGHIGYGAAQSGSIYLGTDDSPTSLYIQQNGDIGVGTVNPKAMFHVSNIDNTVGSILASATETKFGLYTKTYTTTIDHETFRLGLKYDENENNGFISFYRGQSSSGGFLGFSTDGTERLRINRAGNVGIGTLNPDEKLSVNGKIHTKEVKVDLNGWSDFVFDKTYDLPTLEEVENHINVNGHLIDVPSEKDVLENGILLGEMDAKLLQKIEELTLYTIEQEKQLTKQQKEITLLQDQNKVIEEQAKDIKELKALVNKLLQDK